ncbi:MAG: hypothetical protein L0Y71_11065 [Gemmataceae bacterium]|nr:hypothetical protein [Gemmataceae bacterium]
MSTSPRSLIEKHVRGVRRRLVLQNFIHALWIAWAVALGVSCVWFLVEALLPSTFLPWVRWTVPAALLGAGTLAALVHAWLTAPPLVAASLVFDERCELKERVTTFLTLPSDMLDQPAGQALARDVQDQIAKLDTAGRFGLALRWRTALLPVGAGALAIVAALFAPALGSISLARTTKTNPANIDAAEIQQQLDNLRKVTFAPKDAELKSEKLKDLEAQWDKLVNKPLDPNNEDKIRERVGEMKAMEDQLKRRADELKAQSSKGKDIQQLLKELAQLDNKKLDPGPAKDLEDALKNGDMGKVRDILDKLAKDMKAGKLDADKLKKLAEQFEELHARMKRALDQQDLKKKLEEKFKKGEINKEQFDREMQNLKDQKNELKEWQELADLLGQCKECMNDGDMQKAGEEIGKALEKVKTIELTEEELQEILDRLENLEEAENRILGQLRGNGLNGGGPPGAERPIDPDDPNSKIVNQRQKARVDAKGQQRVIGFAKGGNFTKISSQEIGGAFKQAAQDAPEALDRQRIPEDAADLARGFFEKLGGQK